MRIRSNSELSKMMPKRKVLQFNDVAHCGQIFSESQHESRDVFR